MKTIRRNLLLLAMAASFSFGEENSIRIWGPEERVKSYFPIWDSKTKTGLSDCTAQYGTGLLQRVGEPCLRTPPKDCKKEVFRFTLLQSRGDHFCVRIDRQGEGFRLWAKRVDVHGRILLEQKERLLGTSETAKTDQLLKAWDFFRMATQDKPVGLDGTSWILEGLREGRYHAIEHWSPDVETKARGLTALYEFCKFLIMNDGLKETPKNMGYEIFRQ